jgi:predicted phage replisome organizer
MSKKFYWLKLKDDFFNQREIKKLRKIAGGDTFVIIYLKMQLLSIKKDGKIEFECTEETMLDQLELELDEDKNNISITISYLMSNNLLELVDNDYLLPKVCESIGRESDSAERVRRHRERKALQCNEKELQCNRCNVTSNTEIEIEIDKEIDKDIEIEKREIQMFTTGDNGIYRSTCGMPEVDHMVYQVETQNSIDKNSVVKNNIKDTRHKYGEYKHILLTDTQYNKLIYDFGEAKLTRLIKELDEGIQLKGYKYKDFNLAIRKWEKNSKDNEPSKSNDRFKDVKL